MLICALQQSWWKSADPHTRGWTKTLNRHLHRIRALVVYRKSVWNAQGCQALITLTQNEVWRLPFNLAFSVYTVKILHVLFVKKPTSSLFDTSPLLALELFIEQCQQWIRCIIVLQHFPSMLVSKRSNCVCRIKWGQHPSASMRDWDGTADCLALLVLGACQMAGLPSLAFPMQEETWGHHKTDGWRGESIWLDYTYSEIWERAWQFLISAAS